ncbi:MAG: CoA transferase [Caulobacteraceae bacterium]|nr:CoA transferase [Caulobacteraceae bacterium]
MTAFEGLRVVDVSQGLAGPMATMLLADFGAEVVKVEPPGGDRLRDAPGYLTWNRGKARTVLDPETAEDLEVLKDLVGGADVAVFDHAPGRLEALGLDGRTLTARHPRLVHLWVPPFGVSGPWSALPEHHGMLVGLTGTAFRQGSYADQPIWHVMPMVLHGQAVMAAGAAAAALKDRFRTGLGQAVIVSGAHANAEIAGPLGLLDAPGMMQGHPLGGSASYRLYQCGDGEWLFLATLFPHFFERAVEALKLRERVAGESPIFDAGLLIERVFREKTRAEWLAVLAAHDVPAAPVSDRADWLNSGPLTDNALRLTFDHPELGPVEMPGAPIKLAETPASVRGLMREATAEELKAFARPRPAPEPAGGGALPPLAGVKVLDLGTVIAGAYASCILANFGADVIKIESAEGDPFRPFGPGFTNHNRGKRGLGLNLKDPEGRAAFLDLARGADVVVDNYRLGVRRRLGIDYEVLRAVNPRIVSASINAYGSTGAEAHLPGFDPLLQARSGMMAAQGGPGEEPVFHSVAVNDVATAAVAAFGVIAALNAREVTGRGQNVETCLAAQSALFQSAALTTWTGAPAPPVGERDCIGFSAVDRYYPCADGWITLGLTTPGQAAALEAALGGDDWGRRFPDVLNQPRRGDLAREIAGLLRARRRSAVLAALTAAGVPATPVFRGDEARGEQWLWESGFFELRRHPAWGDMIASRAFADFSRGGAGFTRLDPDLGEHTVEVLREFGFDMDRIRRLADARLIFRG